MNIITSWRSTSSSTILEIVVIANYLVDCRLISFNKTVVLLKADSSHLRGVPTKYLDHIPDNHSLVWNCHKQNSTAVLMESRSAYKCTFVRYQTVIIAVMQPRHSRTRGQLFRLGFLLGAFFLLFLFGCILSFSFVPVHSIPVIRAIVGVLIIILRWVSGAQRKKLVKILMGDTMLAKWGACLIAQILYRNPSNHQPPSHP